MQSKAKPDTACFKLFTRTRVYCLQHKASGNSLTAPGLSKRQAMRADTLGPSPRYQPSPASMAPL
jgi:hypothetical protein